MKYLNDYKVFEGKLLSEKNITGFPECLEKEHIKKVRNMLITEELNPDWFRVSELPIEGVYYFEKAVSKVGVDYFGIDAADDGTLTPTYTTIDMNENGYNNFPCTTIKESIEKMEC